MAVKVCQQPVAGLERLGLVIEAGKRGLDQYGAGTASVRFICGTFDIHRTLEERIAQFLSTQASLTYVSCWNANTGLFPVICEDGSAIISDELNHASIIDGCRLASKSRRERYKHSDMADLEAKLKAANPQGPILIVTDGVTNMEEPDPDRPGRGTAGHLYGLFECVLRGGVTRK